MQSKDIAIIGGGISGLGIAFEAQKRNLSFVMFESGKIGAGTSDNSHNVIHSGLRYLQSLNLSRVLESIEATAEIKNEFGVSVMDLPCLMAVNNRTLTKNKFALNAAGYFFNYLTGGKIIKPEILTKAVLGKELPLKLPMENLFPQGAFCWHDLLLISHNQLCSQILKRISAGPNEILENTKVSRVVKTAEHYLVHKNSGNDSGYQVKAVVNAAGSLVDGIMLEGIAQLGMKLDWCRAFNVVLNKLIVPKYGLGLQSSKSRLFFFVPRSEELTAIGTEYLPLIKNSQERKVSELEISEFIKEAGTAIRQKLSLNDVKKVEVGILPVSNFRGNQPILLGNELLEQSEGYVKVISTKYTTFMPQAKKVLNLIENYLRRK